MLLHIKNGKIYAILDKGFEPQAIRGKRTSFHFTWFAWLIKITTMLHLQVMGYWPLRGAWESQGRF